VRRRIVVVSQEEHLEQLSKGYRFDWKDSDHSVFEPKRGLSAAVVEEISALKSEPDWMRKYRLKALKHFERGPMPWWGADLSDIDFTTSSTSPLDREAGQQLETCPRTSGVPGTAGHPRGGEEVPGWREAQYESEVVYHKIKKELDDIGVLFTDMDSALRDYPDLVKEYFGTLIPPNDNKFAALNTAVWSGRVVHATCRLACRSISAAGYFRINAETWGSSSGR